MSLVPREIVAKRWENRECPRCGDQNIDEILYGKFILHRPGGEIEVDQTDSSDGIVCMHCGYEGEYYEEVEVEELVPEEPPIEVTEEEKKEG